MKTSLWIVFLLLITSEASAQWKWFDPQNTQDKDISFIHNQGWNEDGGNYLRLPARAGSTVRKEVWNLACQSAGLSIRFKTDAANIRVRYEVTGGYSMPHMPATGVSGVDLYRLNTMKQKEFCFGNYSFADTISYAFNVDRRNQKNEEYEYILYLPLYNGVKWLKIGVADDDSFSFIPVSNQKPIVLYGTSIAQGACASRPGMAWSNILERSVNIPVINLGFSGNGRLEKEVLDLLLEQDARVYIIDCMANLSDRKADEIKALVKKAVYQLRGKNETPILLIEHAGYSNAYTSEKHYETYTQPNNGQRSAYQELKVEKVKNLFYLSNEELNYHPDSWVDYVHPSDLGMIQQAAAVEKKIREILQIPVH